MRALCLVSATVALLLAAGAPAATTSADLAGRPLVDALRRGGYVLYFRHAATDFSQTDTNTRDLANCRTQRNLNAEGRRDARAIGRAFRTLRIPVGSVLASKYCRTRETALLAFRRVGTTLDLTSLPSARDEAERERRVRALRRLLATRPPRASNTVLVAHLFNIEAAADVALEEGEAGIFLPRPPNGFRLVARVMPEGWTRLAALSA